ncbi:MAG: response regulator transcription factor [Bacteroidota bacterium]
MKIMIVEDHPAMRRILRWIVDSSFDQRHTIIDCGDGFEALQQFAEFHPDLVLMDIQLQETNGFELTEAMYRKDPDTKVIFVTSHDTPIFRNKADTLHARGFILKDNLSELPNIIQSLTLEGGIQ